MKELIGQINSTYCKRTQDLSMQRDLWIKLSNQFRPEISQYRTTRPSVLIVRETGDLGLAVLWIVQTALVRPIIKDISLNSQLSSKLSEMITGINNNSIIALAHSEDPKNPVTFTESDCILSLKGEKKFITAGKNADIVIATSRKEKEEKVSSIIFISRSDIENNLEDLNLKIFKSVNHSKLRLDNFNTSREFIPEIKPELLRRSLKRWGIIERALICESFISFLIYVNRLFASKEISVVTDNELSSMLEIQSASASKQINEAVYGERVETVNLNLERILNSAEKFKSKYMENYDRFIESEHLRLADLSLFDSLR